MSDTWPKKAIDPAEAIAIAKQVERETGNRIARVEVYDLDKMAASGRRCVDCGAVIPTCYWIQKCDPCLDAMLEDR